MDDFTIENDLSLTIAQVIKKYGLLQSRGRSKSLGQHFLCDESLLKKIASCGAPFGDFDIVEIGPGPCGLTRAILEVSSEKNRVFCVEKDENLKPVHDNIQTSFPYRLFFTYEDALNVKPQDLSSKSIIIIANLPYNVGTQLLINWLLNLKGIEKMILMFQQEVANRICAEVGGREYGRLSVIAQLLCKTEKLFSVSNKAFYPPPKVTSAVIKLTPKNINIENLSNFEKLTSICFQHRRKTIYSILKCHYSVSFLDSSLESCCVCKMARPETISPEKFLELANALSKKM